MTNGQGTLEKFLENFSNISCKSWNSCMEFMLCYGESKRQHKIVPTVFWRTMLLVCDGLWITSLLTLNKLQNWVKSVLSCHLTLSKFLVAVNLVDSFWLFDWHIWGNTVYLQKVGAACVLISDIIYLFPKQKTHYNK